MTKKTNILDRLEVVRYNEFIALALDGTVLPSQTGLTISNMVEDGDVASVTVTFLIKVENILKQNT